MKEFALVVTGSALGGVARYWLSGVVGRRVGETFPWGTMAVNVSGAFAIGAVAALAASNPGFAALGLWHGPIHAECRLAGPEVYVLEVAARPIGGLCSRALQFGERRVPLEELLLRHALGEDVSGVERAPEASGVMMIPIPKRGIYRRVDGVEAARAVAGIDDIRITAKADAAVA